MADSQADEDILRIFFATDNHLGVWERDQVRKGDSFRTWEEIFHLASELDVDMVLLGGDIFHENKPSRASIVRCIETMSKYCFSKRPISFQLISDQESQFEGRRVNFEDENVSVGIPVFSIHGNHDDPTGEEHLSAVDILARCKVLNYFGKSNLTGEGMGQIQLSPLLIRKGSTQLALYGLGYIRDERLGRLFNTPGCVNWSRPRSDGDLPEDNWFNICVVHQNRTQHGINSKNCLQEKDLPRFLDLVLWGHEHESFPDAVESHSADGSISIIQPGSSVVTALTEGEAKRKHVVVIEVKGQQWRSIKYPLTTIRPFKYEQVVLSKLKNVDLDDPEAVTEYLSRRVEQCIADAQAERAAVPGSEPDMLPLVRIKVDYTGYTTLNTQRFGQPFVGRVANAHDLLHWTKKETRKAAVQAMDMNNTGTLGGGWQEGPKLENLVQDHLPKELHILSTDEMGEALNSFVNKEERAALHDCVDFVLKDTFDTACQDERIQEAEQHNSDKIQAILDDICKVRREKIAQQYSQEQATTSTAPNTRNQPNVPQSTPPAAPSQAKRTTTRRKAPATDNDAMDLDDAYTPENGVTSFNPGLDLPPPSQATGKRGSGMGGLGGSMAVGDESMGSESDDEGGGGGRGSGRGRRGGRGRGRAGRGRQSRSSQLQLSAGKPSNKQTSKHRSSFGGDVLYDSEDDDMQLNDASKQGISNQPINVVPDSDSDNELPNKSSAKLSIKSSARPSAPRQSTFGRKRTQQSTPIVKSTRKPPAARPPPIPLSTQQTHNHPALPTQSTQATPATIPSLPHNGISSVRSTQRTLPSLFGGKTSGRKASGPTKRGYDPSHRLFNPSQGGEFGQSQDPRTLNLDSDDDQENQANDFKTPAKQPKGRWSKRS